MALYLKAAGGNYSAAATWSATSSAGVDNAGPPALSDDVILELASGNLTVDATSSAKTFSCTGGTGNYTGTITHNAFNLTVAGAVTLSSGCTYTPLATSTLTISVGSTLTTAGKLLPLLAFTDISGTLTLGDNLSFMASKVITLTLSSSLDMNGKTVAGNSSINRILIQSSTTGTARTILNATTSFSNADFMDCTFTSATSLDLSAITGLSGDCGGNSITGGGSTLTFTPTATQTATGTASFSWSTHGWTTRVPLPQDDVVVSNAFIAGRTVTMDMPRIGRSVNFSGLSGTPTLAFTTSPYSVFGSFTLLSGITWSQNQSITFRGRGNYTLTCGGRTFASAMNFTAPGGTYTLQDTYAGSVNSTWTLTNGAFITGNNAMTAATYTSSGSTVRTLTLGTSILTELATSGTDFNFGTTTNFTFSGASATFVFGATTASTRTFAGGGLSYGTLTYTIAGSTGDLIISGSNTFGTLNFSDVTNARILQITSGTTQTFTTSFTGVLGTSGKLMTLKSTSNGSAHTLINSTGSTVSTDYLSIRDSHAIGANRWLAGTHSTDVSGNTGWVFSNVLPANPSSNSGGAGGLQSKRNRQNLLNLT